MTYPYGEDRKSTQRSRAESVLGYAQGGRIPSQSEIDYAQKNPTDGVLEDFEKKFGPGSSRQYLSSSKAIVEPKPLRRRRKHLALGGAEQ